MSSELYHPLVSVAVVTYNSAQTLLETLESIKAQTYDRLELIISDDCSSDNTIQLCKDWILANKDRFVRTVILESERNTGVTANYKRSEEACGGEWIKSIAGDDLLVPTCVADYVEYVTKNPDTVIVFGRVSCFGGSRRQLDTFEKDIFRTDFYSWSAQKQYEFLLGGNCIPSAAAFYSAQKMKELDVPYDVRIPFMEDWPRWINLTKKGVQIPFIDKVTAKYRVNGISNKRDIWSPSVTFYRSTRLFDFLYL